METLPNNTSEASALNAASATVNSPKSSPASAHGSEITAVKSPTPEEVTVPVPEETNNEPEVAVSLPGNDVEKANGETEKHEDVESVTEKKQEKTLEESLPPEVDGVDVPPHWHEKPCVHIASNGGIITEEELLPLFTEHGKVSSVVYENEQRDAAIIRYDSVPGEEDQLIARVREKLHNTQLGDRTLLIEPFRPDSLLFIGNLTSDIDDARLRKMFEPHGNIERAFVLHNSAGHSKGYGFVEYSLKSQAATAKIAMGNINMDGRVLRVEWSDCRKVSDMFSTVLFVDRLPKENPNIEASLKALFGQYGKVRDCHLAIGLSHQFRGFGFIDFYHSIFADRAHEGLDGHQLEGSKIRVSFANPSKSAQSSKLRFGTPAVSAGFAPMGRGAVPGMMVNQPLRGHMAMPMLGPRFTGAGRAGMLGMGIGMQFGRGAPVGQPMLNRSLVPPLIGRGAGIIGAGVVGSGMMGRCPPVLNNVAPRPSVGVGGGTVVQLNPRLPAQGPLPMSSATVAQVANSQAKVREEGVKVRVEGYYQHQSYPAGGNLLKQPNSQYAYQQPAHEQTTFQSQYQQQAGPQTQQSYQQYYAQPAQSYVQQQQPGQYPQSDSYYQQQSVQQGQAIGAQQYAYTQQYGQQYGQPYIQQVPQQYALSYNQPPAQSNGQLYQQTVQPPAQSQYTQQTYTDNYSQQQQPWEQQSQTYSAAPATNVAGVLAAQTQDPSQQQAYATYYNQQAVTPASTGAVQTSSVVGTTQSLEAQWAAYYASQAAYQQTQPPASQDAGQKRTADQMDAGSQNQQTTYNYPQQTIASYPQQIGAGMGAYQQQQQMPPMAYQQQYQQQPVAVVSGYQQQTTAFPYQQQAAVPGYQQSTSALVSSGYDQSVAPVADGYQQPPPAAQGQAIATPIYDYNKRPRF